MNFRTAIATDSSCLLAVFALVALFCSTASAEVGEERGPLEVAMAGSSAYANEGRTLEADVETEEREGVRLADLQMGDEYEEESHWLGFRGDLGRGVRVFGASYRGGRERVRITDRHGGSVLSRRVGVDLTLRRSGQSRGWGIDGNVQWGHSGLTLETGGGVAALGGEFRAVVNGAVFLSFLMGGIELGYRYVQPILTGPRPAWLPGHHVMVRMNLPFVFVREGEAPDWIFGSE